MISTMQDHTTDPADAREPTGSPTWLRVLDVVLALAVVATLASAAFTVVQVRRHHDSSSTPSAASAASTPAGRRAALAAGRAAAVAFTSFDYRHLGRDTDWVIDHATGRFRDKFAKAVAELNPEIRKAHGISVGHVVEAGLERSTADTAVMIAAVDARVTNDASPTPGIRRYRLAITLVRVDGRWRTSQIQPVP